MSDGFAFVGFNVKSEDDINTIIANKKNRQVIVHDPLAEGEDFEFIDSISQDNEGVIIPTKKAVRIATEDQSGLMSAEDKVALAHKVNAPSQDGTDGQILKTNGDGTTAWTTVGTPTDAQVEEAVSDWLDEHPEATTTVQDGSISRTKLNDDLKTKTDYAEKLHNTASITKSSDASYTIDLDVADPQGNVLVRLKDGHIQTKNFNSSDIEGRLSDAEDAIDDLQEDTSDLGDRMTEAEEDIDALETAVEGKQDALTFDNIPIQNSPNPVKSGGVYSALQSIPQSVDVKDSTEEDVDIDISDASGNVVARFAGGHFQTKEFDSRDMKALVPEAEQSDVGKALIAKTVSGGKVIAYEFGETGSEPDVEVKDDTESGIDLDVSDARGNVLVRFKDGHIQTKEFDSSDIDGMKDDINSKQDAPSSSGTAGQVLGLNNSLKPVWVDQSGGGGSGNVDVKDSTEQGVDLDVSDNSGHVVMRLKDGHIQTKNFDSSAFETPLETFNASATYVRGQNNTITITNQFKKGEHIIFHLEDGNRYDAYGRYASYYEGSKQIYNNRRGSNGYVDDIISADCNSVSIVIGGYEYTDGTALTLYVYVIRGEIKPTVITVKSDGTGMFSTLKSAVDSISGANHVTNPYVIEVYPGTYDTLAGFTDEEIASADIGGGYTQDSMVGLKLRDGISLIGIGRADDIILTAELDPNDWTLAVRGNISTLNLQGQGDLENVTIIGKNIRYCVHDDFTSPINSHDRRVLRNVKFDGVNLSYSPHFTTYGAGMTAPRDYLIENCDFGYDLGIHSNGGYAFGCTIEVNNCSGCRFRIGDYATSDSDAVNRVIVNNCNFQVIRTNHSNNALKNHMKLEGVGNNNSMIYDQAGNLYRLGMIDLAPTGLTKGSLVQRNSTEGLGFVATHDISVAHGVVIGSDTYHSYVQKEGFISTTILGISSLATLSVGSYVTVDTSTNLLVAGGTASTAVGIVKAIDDAGARYIKLLI